MYWHPFAIQICFVCPISMTVFNLFSSFSPDPTSHWASMLRRALTKTFALIIAQHCKMNKYIAGLTCFVALDVKISSWAPINPEFFPPWILYSIYYTTPVCLCGNLCCGVVIWHTQKEYAPCKHNISWNNDGLKDSDTGTLLRTSRSGNKARISVWDLNWHSGHTVKDVAFSIQVMPDSPSVIDSGTPHSHIHTSSYRVFQIWIVWGVRNRIITWDDIHYTWWMGPGDAT